VFFQADYDEIENKKISYDIMLIKVIFMKRCMRTVESKYENKKINQDLTTSRVECVLLKRIRMH